MTDERLSEGAIGGWGVTLESGETVVFPCFAHCLCCAGLVECDDEVCAECKIELAGGPMCRGNQEIEAWERAGCPDG